MTWTVDNLPWLRRAAARYRPQRSEPLRVRAWLRSPIAWDASAPPQLEGALQHVVVRRETGRMPDDVFAGCTREEAPDVPIPILDERIGGLRIARASAGWPWPDCREGTRYRNKRARLDAIGGAGRVTVSGGMFKSLHIPTAVLHTPILDFFVHGDRAQLEDLLAEIPGLGRDHTRGPGGVERWEVTVDPLDRALVHLGRPMRPLPRVEDGSRYDHRAFVPGSYEQAVRTTRAPYWRTWLASLCIVPVIPVGDPTSWWADVVRGEHAAAPQTEPVNEAPGARVTWEIALAAVERYRNHVERVSPERARSTLLWHLRHARPMGAAWWEGPGPLSLQFRAETRGDTLLVVDVTPGRPMSTDERPVAPTPDTTTDWFAAIDDLPAAPSPERSGARGRFFVTPYAVRRYRERIRPRLAEAAARDELIDLTTRGTVVGPYVGTGLRAAYPDLRLELWRAPRVGTKRQHLAQSRCRFVVGYGEGALPQVITVLPGVKKRSDER